MNRDAARAALGMSMMYTRDRSTRHIDSVRVLELAEAMDDTAPVAGPLRDLVTRSHLRISCGATLAQQLQRVAGRHATETDLAMADRMMASSLHYLGDQAGTCACALRAINAPIAPDRHLQTIHYGSDQRVGAFVSLARALWLQGFADRAIRAAQAGVDEAIKVGRANSVCLALADGASLIRSWPIIVRMPSSLEQC
jgi:hypothetical protein